MDSDSVGDLLTDVQKVKSGNIENTKESVKEEVSKILSPEIRGAPIEIMDSESVGDRQEEIQISKSDDVENDKESMEENIPKFRDVFREGDNVDNAKEPVGVPKILRRAIPATVENMDSDSDGGQEAIQMFEYSDVVENTNESMEDSVEDLVGEDVPKILSPELGDVFPIFASMLDIKSFMKLAMTSKKMYERCHEDNRITVRENEVSVAVENGLPSFCFTSEIVKIHVEKYLEKLRQLKCNVSLRTIQFYRALDEVTMTETRRYLEELGVKNIADLNVWSEFSAWQQISFIKDFDIRIVSIDRGLPDDVLRSVLQYNHVDEFTYNGPIQGEMLLEVDCPIQHLILPSLQLSADVFMQILWKIQTGPLKKLSVNEDQIPWDDFTSVVSGYEEPLPAERPLLINSADYGRWFLHWNGAVTRCVLGDGEVICDISKCEGPADFPAVLASEEAVHKALDEKNGIFCLKHHFTSFFDGFPVLEASHEGPFPEERPLLCKTRLWDELHYFVLNEDGSIDEYSWSSENARHARHYDMETSYPFPSGHRPLQKFLMEKRLRKLEISSDFDLENTEEVRSLFDEYTTLPFEYMGPLPDVRPLFFQKKRGNFETRIVLYEDGSLGQYLWFEDTLRMGRSPRCLFVTPCEPWNHPRALVYVKMIKKILLKAPFDDLGYSVDLNIFRDAFKGFKTLSFNYFGPFPTECPLVFKKNEKLDGKVIEHRWFVQKNGEVVRHYVWKDGHAKIGPAECLPPILAKKLVKDFCKGVALHARCAFTVDRVVLNDYLEEFDILPFDEPWPLPENRPLIFQKSEIKHTCGEGTDEDCECDDEVLHLWRLCRPFEMLRATWGEKKDRQLKFYKASTYDKDLPPVLKTKEAKDYLSQDTPSVSDPMSNAYIEEETEAVIEDEAVEDDGDSLDSSDDTRS